MNAPAPRYLVAIVSCCVCLLSCSIPELCGDKVLTSSNLTLIEVIHKLLQVGVSHMTKGDGPGNSKLAGLYLCYAIYYTQPLEVKVRVRCSCNHNTVTSLHANYTGLHVNDDILDLTCISLSSLQVKFNFKCMSNLSSKTSALKAVIRCTYLCYNPKLLISDDQGVLLSM